MDRIIYEHPLNERMRIFLRLDHLFKQLDCFYDTRSQWDCKNYTYTLVEIIDLLDRNDLRQEITKELEKQIKYLNSLQISNGINQDLLNETISDLNIKLDSISNMQWKLTKNLNKDELIIAIKNKVSLSGAACSFDCPAFYQWLNLPEIIRNKKLTIWHNEIKPVKDCIYTLLSIIRNGSMFAIKKAESGYYQQDLDLPQPCQIIRISMPSKFFPQVSGDKHRVSIRFYSCDEIELKPQQLEQDLDFELSCCTLF